MECQRTKKTIKAGDHIRDIEDGDCWFEGIMQNDKEYLVTKVYWSGEWALTKEEDEVIGTIITPKWYYVELI